MFTGLAVTSALPLTICSIACMCCAWHLLMVVCVHSLKPGKVVIVLGGRFAGKKAVIVQNVDQGTNTRRFGHALIAGIERYPLKVTKTMSKRVLARRSRIKPFVKAVNYNHLMPTRYALDLGEGVKTAVPMDAGSNPTARSKARKEVAKLLQDRFNSGKNKWFFSKLRF